jgi:hypothetical protein
MIRTPVTLDMRRSITYQVLVPTILISIAIVIIYLAFVNEIGSFLEVSTEILLGLWGIQTILVPSNISEPTVMDPLIMALYVLFLFVIFVRFAIRPLWNKFSGNRTEKPLLPFEEEVATLANYQLEQVTLNSIRQESVHQSIPGNHRLTSIPSLALFAIALALFIRIGLRRKGKAKAI